MMSESSRAESSVFVGAPNSVGHEHVVDSMPAGLRTTGQMPGYTGHVPGLGTESYGRAYSASTRRLYAAGGEPQHLFLPAGKSGALSWEIPEKGVPVGYTGHVPGRKVFGPHGKTRTAMLAEATAKRRAGLGAREVEAGASFLPLSEVPRRVGGNTGPVPLADMLDKVEDGAAASPEVSFEREVVVAIHAISDKILTGQHNRLHRTLETQLHVKAVRLAQQAEPAARAAMPTARREPSHNRVDRATFGSVLAEFNIVLTARVLESIFRTVAVREVGPDADLAAVETIDIEAFTKWIEQQAISRHGSSVIHPPEDYADFEGHWGTRFVPRSDV